MIKINHVINDITKETGCLYIGAYIYDEASNKRHRVSPEDECSGIVFWFEPKDGDIEYINSFVINPEERQAIMKRVLNYGIECDCYYQIYSDALIINKLLAPLKKEFADSMNILNQKQSAQIMMFESYRFSLLVNDMAESSSSYTYGLLSNRYGISGLHAMLLMALDNPHKTNNIVPYDFPSNEQIYYVDFNERINTSINNYISEEWSSGGGISGI